MTNQPNVSWPGWEVVRLIGRGSFGAVYEIRRNLFGEEESAALKVISIPPDQSDVDELYGAGFDDEGITATFQSHMKSVLAEYSLMRKMNGHSNIVNCDDVSCIQHEDGFGWDIYIKMELLTPLLKSLPAGSVPEETVVKVAHDLCQALVLCKKNDIVHRDIKPQNIFVSPNGDYKLGDFGIAKTVEKTTGGTKVGTYRYMAPEVYNNQPYGSGADIYSLGLVLYQLLNERRLPFMPLPPEMPRAGQDEAARERRLAGEAIPAPVHGSEELKAIVLKACAYDPKERFASAEEMLAAVKALMKEEETAVPVIVPPVPEVKPTTETPAEKIAEEVVPAEEPAAVPDPVVEETTPVPAPIEEPVVEEPAPAPVAEPVVEEPTPAPVAKPTEKETAPQPKPAKKKKYRLISIALITVIVAVIIFVKFIWTGWISLGENRYYYVKGEKAVGITTIEDKQYYFNDSGAMQTGWQTVGKNTYYFNSDGIMQTGFQTINGNKYYLGNSGVLHTGWLNYKNQTYFCSNSNGGRIATGKWTIDGENYYFNNNGIMATGAVEISANNVYYFDDNGHFQYCEITQNNIGSSRADERVTFTNRGGGQTRSYYRKLDTPLEGVLSLSGEVSITETKSGNCEGQWQFHIRTSNGKWKRIGFFEVKDGKGQFEYVLDDPVSFDAYVCTCYENKEWSASSSQAINAVTYRTYDFGPAVKSE